MHTLVFDIGKTNKKWIIFDELFGIIDESSEQLEESIDDDGDPCENIKLLSKWFLDQVQKQLAKKDNQIGKINVSAYGATLVHLDQSGNVCTPVYNYLKEIPEDSLLLFQKYVGDLSALAKQTGAAITGMLNTGFQLFYLKEYKPELFNNISCSLHLPQYLSFLLTRNLQSETTSLGCHTSLVDFETHDWHEWVTNLGIHKKLPPLVKSVQTSLVGVGDKMVEVGPGIHDSSAALFPYLSASHNPFVLISTGTWSISLNPFGSGNYNQSDLENDIVLYMQPNGNAVRASRLFMGRSYAENMDRIRNKYHKNELPNYSFEKTKSWLAETKLGNMDASGFEEEILGLHFELAKKQYESYQLAANGMPFDTVYLDGGFANNQMFLHMLADLLYPTTLAYAEQPMGSALGAALVMSKDGLNLIDFWKLYSIKKIEL